MDSWTDWDDDWCMYGPWNIWNHPIVDENWVAIRCYQPQAHITSDASQVQFPQKMVTLGTKMVIVQIQLAHVGTFSTSGQTKSITLSLVSFADLGASGSSVTALMTWPPGWKAGRKTWDTVETEEHGYSNGHIMLIRMAVGEQKNVRFKSDVRLSDVLNGTFEKYWKPLSSLPRNWRHYIQNLSHHLNPGDAQRPRTPKNQTQLKHWGIPEVG